jgi:hypothetical protein
MNYILLILARMASLNAAVRLRVSEVSLGLADSTVPCPKDFIPESISNAVILSKWTDSSVVSYRCNHGYVSSGFRENPDDPRVFSVPCLSAPNGRISASTEINCIVGHCDLSQLNGIKYANLTVSDPSVKIDSVISIDCVNGHSIDGLPTGPRTRQLTCDQDLNIVPLYVPLQSNDCRPVKCGKLILPENSKPPEGYSIRKELHYGDSVHISCEDGYYYKSALGSTDMSRAAFNITCTADGNLVPVENPPSLLVGQCVPISCGPLPNFEGADALTRSDSLHLNSEAAYICQRGFHFINSTYIPESPISQSHWTHELESMVPRMTSFKVACVYESSDQIAVYDTDPSIAKCIADSSTEFSSEPES